MRSSRLVGSVVAALALFESARRARTHRVGPTEERVFRAFNNAPNSLHVPVWVVMQSGSLAAVYVVAGELLRRDRPRTATIAAIAGTAVWGGVKLGKPLIGRGRPAHLLERVAVRGHAQTGIGYPSGHAAVALTLAIVATRDCGPMAVAGGLTAAGITGGARIYVGAHLPLDVVGGFAIGALCGRFASWVAAVG